MYKTSDATCETRDWVSLNFDAIPTSVIQKLFGDSPEDLARVLPEPEDCAHCGGSGVDPVDQDEDCERCKASGDEPETDESRELYGWPAAHGHVWTCEDRPEIREALLASGFIVYTDESREGYFCDVLIVGIDGGGYSFYGQHWIPFRVRLARHSAEFLREAIRPELRTLLQAEAQREGATLIGSPVFGA